MIAAKPWPKGAEALLWLFRNENLEEASRLVIENCKAKSHRGEALLRIYLMDELRERLSPEAKTAIEDLAWELVTGHHLGMSRMIAEHATLTTFLIPNNGQTNRWPHHHFRQPIWASALLYCYGWHDIKPDNTFIGPVYFLTSTYRPPAIVTAIARDRKRDGYRSTTNRPGWTGWHDVEKETIYSPRAADNKIPVIIIDKGGASHFRRDIHYTPDYALGTTTTDPKRTYSNELNLTPIMGATFAADASDRLAVVARGFYANRSINGITANAVSIIARDPNTEFGNKRFQSDGTRVFVSKGTLWDNRVEDPSGWFFTRCGDAYAAIRPAAGGYQVSDITHISTKERNVEEGKEANGQFLDLNDMWAPIVLQMGRAADYKSFEVFQTSVKESAFTYEDGKLTYISEAGDTFEFGANSMNLPTINGEPVNLNPQKTYDSPFLSMDRGSSKAVISYPGYDDVTVDFGREN